VNRQAFESTHLQGFARHCAGSLGVATKVGSQAEAHFQRSTPLFFSSSFFLLEKKKRESSKSQRKKIRTGKKQINR
jgi:hypothetical protein